MGSQKSDVMAETAKGPPYNDMANVASFYSGQTVTPGKRTDTGLAWNGALECDVPRRNMNKKAMAEYLSGLP